MQRDNTSSRTPCHIPCHPLICPLVETLLQPLLQSIYPLIHPLIYTLSYAPSHIHPIIYTLSYSLSHTFSCAYRPITIVMLPAATETKQQTTTPQRQPASTRPRRFSFVGAGLCVQLLSGHHLSSPVSVTFERASVPTAGGAHDSTYHRRIHAQPQSKPPQPQLHIGTRPTIRQYCLLPR